MEWIILTGSIIGISGLVYTWRKAHRVHLDNTDIYMREMLRRVSEGIERRRG